MYKRTLSNTIHAISESFPVLMLTGPRQVGKTTLLEMCAAGRPPDKGTEQTMHPHGNLSSI